MEAGTLKLLSLVSRGGLVIIVYFFFPPPHPRLGSGDLGGKGKGQSISHKNMQTRLEQAEGGWRKGRKGLGHRDGGKTGRQGEGASILPSTSTPGAALRDQELGHY